MSRLARLSLAAVSGFALFLAGCDRRRAQSDSDAPPADAATPADPAVSAAVARVVETGRHPWLRWPDVADVVPELRRLYGAESDGLLWFQGEAPHRALPEALDALSGASERGLDPSDYDAGRLRAEWTRLSASPAEGSDRAWFDLAVSVGLLREMQAVHSGRVDPRTLDWGYDVGPKKLDRSALLRQARDGEGVAALLNGLEPSFPHYVRNRRTLALYRSLLSAGEPDPVPLLPKGRRKVEPGEPWTGVPLLQSRLRTFGDLAVDAPPEFSPDGTPLYTGPLVDAVKRFQGRHILDPDGVIGNATIDALDVPIAHRVRQLELAMERGRWLPEITDRPTIFVNVPLFRLWASDPAQGGEPLRMKVVVGRSMSHRTPIFLEHMEYVVFRPYWNPPYKIAVEEIVPHARRDPSYLDRENMEIVASGDDDARALPSTPENLDAVVAGRLFVRQKPGPNNSLGLAKFIFPNSENVYMHGTPARQLFSRTRRDFSHGCIRLEDPVRLAEWVLRDVPGWTRERIEAAMRGERPTRVNLEEPLMVVLFYDTVHVNSEGVVHFVGDIYGHDQVLDQALAGGYPYPEDGAVEVSEAKALESR
jgi:murein L,D-transpeptidase YcbB/YkuD